MTQFRSNRTWPVPSERWVMAQKWRNLLFAHWPVELDVLRELLPEQIPVDVYAGSAWVGITPFTLTGLRPRWLPPAPVLSKFPEINVRTYTTIGGKPGVYFFSLDAGSRLAVAGARLTYGLPYFFARAWTGWVDDGFEFRSTRDDDRGDLAAFMARYRVAGPLFTARPGTLEFFLTERYALYTVNARGQVWRAEIDHAPWPLQQAEAVIRTNTMADAAGLELPAVDPVLHFSRYIDVRVWRPRRVPDDVLLKYE